MRIYLEKDKQPIGPYSTDEVLAMLARREVRPLDRAWREDMSEWKSVADVVDLPKPPPLEPRPPHPAAASPGKIRPLKIMIRDICITFGMSLASGTLMGFAAGVANPNLSRDTLMLLIAGGNLVLGPVAFMIVGLLTPQHRWRHLFHVALFGWLVSFVFLPWSGLTFVQGVGSILFYLFSMGVGGGISFLLKRQAQ